MDLQGIKTISEKESTILMVDTSASLVIDLKDDTKTIFQSYSALVYTNSKATVLSCISIFETLWRQRQGCTSS
jgi:PIN domain nuclease of toxin-antitoxin system